MSAHLEKVDQVNWPRIVDAALLQMLHEYGTPLDTAVTSVHGYRVQGARIFASILENLSTPDKPVTYKNPDQLPHPDA